MRMEVGQSIVTLFNSNTMLIDSHLVKGILLAAPTYNNLLGFQIPGQALRIITSAEQSVDYIVHHFQKE